MNIQRASEKDIELLRVFHSRLYDTLKLFGLPFDLADCELESVLTIMLKSKLCYIAVAETDSGDIAGFVSASVVKIDRKLNYAGQNLMGRMHDLYVDDNFRRTGVAKELFKNAEDWMKENGISICESYVPSQNIVSIRFCEKQGYSELGKILYKKL